MVPEQRGDGTFSKYHLANKDRSKARDERKIELLGLDYSGGSAGHEPRTTLQTARPKYVPHQSNQHPYANKFAHLKASLPTHSRRNTPIVLRCWYGQNAMETRKAHLYVLTRPSSPSKTRYRNFRLHEVWRSPPTLDSNRTRKHR